MVHEIIYAGVYSTTPAVVHHLVNPADIEAMTDELMILIQALTAQ